MHIDLAGNQIRLERDPTILGGIRERFAAAATDPVLAEWFAKFAP
jgi:hypothetical protein